MGMVYQWRAHTQVPVDAQVAGEALEQIRVDHNGRLTPEDVVTAARSPASPLHPAFEWCDASAAEAYRLSQASYVIRSIAVHIERPASVAPVRAFVSVKRDEDRSYTSLAHALSDDDLRAQVVSAAWAELVAWRKRYAELVELARVFAVIDQARDAG